jgi:energy-coupling factor transporter ATP-binding protein EcfA2
MFIFNSDREKELGWLNSFCLKKDTKKHLRILIYGPAGSGKSSFINSVDGVCQNRISRPAAASSSGDTFTVTVYCSWQLFIYEEFCITVYTILFVDTVLSISSSNMGNTEIKLHSFNSTKHIKLKKRWKANITRSSSTTSWAWKAPKESVRRTSNTPCKDT